MTKLSTKNLNSLPNSIELKNICKSISALEAIICPEWEFRYYSYQKKWSDTEAFCEMKTGAGDQMQILFSDKGTCINGFCHESNMNKREEYTQNIVDGILDELPDQFREFIFGEPVKSIGTTFCIWNIYTSNNWVIGQVESLNDKYEDGSECLLELLDGNPDTFIKWAEEYYDEEFEMNDLKQKLIEKIFTGVTITKKMVVEINPNLTDFDQLKEDLEEIGYKYTF